MNATTDRPIDRWFASYSGDHRNETNQLIHVVCVPAILWSVIALLWCIPVPGDLLLPGAWAALAMFAAWMFYYRASKPLGLGMLAMFVLMGFLTRLLVETIGLTGLLYAAIAVFVVAWIALVWRLPRGATRSGGHCASCARDFMV